MSNSFTSAIYFNSLFYSHFNETSIQIDASIFQDISSPNSFADFELKHPFRIY